MHTIDCLLIQIGCIATSAILHYFFTAAFSWLVVEILAAIFFRWASKHCWSFIIFFLLGWGKTAYSKRFS